MAINLFIDRKKPLVNLRLGFKYFHLERFKRGEIISSERGNKIQILTIIKVIKA
jgi:hypothetical protein